ncbi:hypothetical protein F5144DRAFT_577796 [Chaetomium tenue]|uniref:Uncharacterized protein n=1 Tax=Chaetomium tenue TaxID=1854479 RepID=A0ACB7P567_9PEZI|nr:hypothetical protein F5144DRAFT_577796 [Chaetomium globosum]
MGRRSQIQTACDRCRQKRAKCDGNLPCQRCNDAGDECKYNYVRQESKGQLRAERVQLRQNNADSDALLRAIASIPDPHVCKAVMQGLLDGSISRHDILKNAQFYSPKPDSGITPLQPELTDPRSTSTSCFEQLLSWQSCLPHLQDDDNGRPETQGASRATSVQPTSLLLPHLPLDAYTTQSHIDPWTKTGWTNAHIRHLIDALRTWDHLPFCLFSEDLFLQDYTSGSTRFCSSALVHAILALSIRLINEGNDDGVAYLSGWPRSRSLLDTARKLLRDTKPPSTLPDVQALGMLSLYYLRCGRETEAQEYADAFTAGMNGLLQSPPPSIQVEEKSHAQSITMSYCGAVSLKRMLSLITGQIFNNPIPAAQEDLFSLSPLPIIDGKRPASSASSSQKSISHSSRTWNNQAHAAHLFQLTEWVYQAIVSAQSDIHAAGGEAGDWYMRCLNWYTDLCPLLSHDDGRTPFVLFIHMYYHFSLLCAFRPFLGHTLDNTGIQPLEVCTQAAKSILSLAQSYDDLFTLRRVSGFMPYFVTAAALFSLSVEGGGVVDGDGGVGSVEYRVGVDGVEEDGDGVKEVDVEMGEVGEMDGVGVEDEGRLLVPGSSTTTTTTPSTGTGEGGVSASVSPSATSSISQAYVTVSAVAHARLLLAKMAITHPAAAVAGRLLEGRIELGHGTM